MVTVSPFSTALISSGSLFLASATLTFISVDDSYLIWLCQLQRTGTGRSVISGLNSDRGEVGGSSPPRPTIHFPTHPSVHQLRLPAPSAVRYSPGAASVSSLSSCVYRSSVV